MILQKIQAAIVVDVVSESRVDDEGSVPLCLAYAESGEGLKNESSRAFSCSGVMERVLPLLPVNWKNYRYSV